MDELGKYPSILLVQAGHITYFLILQVFNINWILLDLIRFGKYLSYAYYKSHEIIY